MFIRFVSGEIDEDSHVLAGLFCAAYDLNGYLPKYEVEALSELKKWFDINWNRQSSICRDTAAMSEQSAVLDRQHRAKQMLRNFVQIMRSGAVGRKSLGTAPKRLVREWLDARDPAAL